jgi:hypothetical protein
MQTMSRTGLTVRGGTGSKRIELVCEHQDGLLYVVPAEASWVCSDELLHVHALAGFLKQLAALDNAEVKEAMQRWGLYYRDREVSSPPPDEEGG